MGGNVRVSLQALMYVHAMYTAHENVHACRVTCTCMVCSQVNGPIWELNGLKCAWYTRGPKRDVEVEEGVAGP